MTTVPAAVGRGGGGRQRRRQGPSLAAASAAALAIAALAWAASLLLPARPSVSGTLPLVRGVQTHLRHLIAVRRGPAGAYFYDRATRHAFVPRGNNLITLASLTDATTGQRILYHSTFNLGLYSPQRIDAALSTMAGEGYNTVRVFLDGRCSTGCLGGSGQGLSLRYLANVADFLRRAYRHHLLVVLTTDFVPARTAYARALAAASSEQIAGVNADYLTAAGVAANAAAWHDLVADLVRLGAPVQDVLAYEPSNEVTLDTHAAPLNGRGGVVTAAIGRYDVTSSAARLRLVTDGLVYWVGRVRAAIRQVDPTALVAVGFPQPVIPGAPTTALIHAVLTRSAADIVDVHLYLRGSADPLGYADALSARGAAKPVLLGEYGALRSAFPTAAAAAAALVGWQRETCAAGFDGWLLWSWNTTVQEELWNAQSDRGTIGRALSPAARPRACG